MRSVASNLTSEGTVTFDSTKKLDMDEALAAAERKRCNCVPCEFQVVIYHDVETSTDRFRSCGLIHHDQRRKYHERQWPHEERRKRSDRRVGAVRQQHGDQGLRPHTESVGVTES